MKDIQMVDLKRQYAKIQEEVDKKVSEVIASSAFINGPEVKSFQSELEEFLDVKHVIPCANGTDALQIAMMSLGLKPGDEVITTTFTFVATAEVIALLGLTPILVDIDPDTFLIDTDAIKKVITPKTKAIVPVHLFGQCADMETIMAIAEEHQLMVIEDSAQSIGASFKFSDGRVAQSGTIGHFGCTSFFPSKNLGCYGDGGALYTNDDALAEKARMMVNHGMKVRYYHDEIGVNSRLDSIQAAVLRIKLRKLCEYNEARNKAAAYYDLAFGDHPKLTIPKRAAASFHVFHQYTMKLKDVDRTAMQEFLKEKGIPAMIYYPVPLHQQKAYRSEHYQDGDFPMAEMVSKQVLSLPMHSELDEEQLAYISEHVLEFVNQ